MKSIFKFLNSSKLYKYSLITLIMSGFAAVVYAAAVPNTFTAGTTAKSSEVNANFTYLQERSWELSGSDLYYSSGNVGIGTTSPSEALEVVGNVKMGWEIVSNACNGINSCAAICASGTRILGGGCNIASGSGEPIRDSYPNNDVTWLCAVEDSTGVSITVYAICANMI